MQEQVEKIQQAKKVVRKPGGENITLKPFYSCLSVLDKKEHILNVSSGSTLHLEEPLNFGSFKGRLTVRMGDYEGGGSVESGDFILPKSLGRIFCTSELNGLSNEVFWDCAKDFEERFSRTLGDAEQREKYIYFSRELPMQHIDKSKQVDIDITKLRQKLEKASKSLRQDWMRNLDIDFYLRDISKYFVSSERAKVYTNQLRWFLVFDVSARDNKNLIVQHYGVLAGTDISQIPNYEDIIKNGRKVTKEFGGILKAPIEKSGSYPVITSGDLTCLLVHETFMHGAEAHRMQEDEWGDKIEFFGGKMKDKIAPDFLEVYDDPTLEEFKGIPLFGHYSFDDEAIPAQRVHLIKKGKLNDLLHSRQSAGCFKRHSNGHARSDGSKDPCPRMGSLIIQPTQEYSFKELKMGLMKACEEQGLPYGLYLTQGMEGFVELDDERYVAMPGQIFRIYKNGRMQRSRGIYITGNPHETLMNITKMGNNYEVHNSRCGAESGLIEKSEVAPEALILNLGMKRLQKGEYRKASTPVLK